MPGETRRRLWLALLASIVIIIVASQTSLYLGRARHPVIFYRGASPNVPQGTALAILNPFRNRKDEENADRLIRDLRTERCEEIARHRLAADPSQLCPVMKQNAKCSLIWLDPEPTKSMWANRRDLWYDLPDSGGSRLVVHFANSDAGWGVNTVELLR